MKNTAKSLVALLIGTGLALAPTAAQAETEVVVYKDQVSQPDTRAGGHVTWPAGGGIRLSTDGATTADKATFAFATADNAFALGDQPIGHDVSVKAAGPAAEPGIQIYAAGALFVKETVYQTWRLRHLGEQRHPRRDQEPRAELRRLA